MYNYGNMNNYYINGWYLLKYKYISLCVHAGCGPAGEVDGSTGVQSTEIYNLNYSLYFIWTQHTVFRICGDCPIVVCVVSKKRRQTKETVVVEL